MTYETSPIMRRMTLAFLRVEKETALPGAHGFPPEIGLAVSACESAWWAAQTGTNNYFGITRPPKFDGDPQSAWCQTWECISPLMLPNFRPDERASAVQVGASKFKMHRWFAVYPSFTAAVEAYVGLLIDAGRYHPAWLAFEKTGDADEFLRAVCAAGYATGPAYKVELEISHQRNILQAVASGRAELLINPAAA